MANDGRPGGLLSIKSGMPDADAEIIKARFTAKNKPGAISVIESEGVDWVDLSTSPLVRRLLDPFEATSRQRDLGGVGNPSEPPGEHAGDHV